MEVKLTKIKSIKRIKLRFNLGKGKNYMHWQITYPNGVKEYLHPDDTNMVLYGCELKNNKKTAQKIYSGEHKTVCAWILCDNIEMIDSTKEGETIRYNPKIIPNWTINGVISDDVKINEIHIKNKNLYKIN